MRQFSDSSAAQETGRKPPPSANYHLVRFIWQLRVAECPASFCVTGRGRINSLPASKGHPDSSVSPQNGRETNEITILAWLVFTPKSSRCRETGVSGSNANGIIPRTHAHVFPIVVELLQLPLNTGSGVAFSNLTQTLLLLRTLFKVRAVIGWKKKSQ